VRVRGKGGVRCRRCHAEEGGGVENGTRYPVAVRERQRRVLVGRRERRAGAGERGGARGPHVMAWADWGRNELGRG
jgi:hypothetical protein